MRTQKERHEEKDSSFYARKTAIRRAVIQEIDKKRNATLLLLLLGVFLLPLSLLLLVLLRARLLSLLLLPLHEMRWAHEACACFPWHTLFLFVWRAGEKYALSSSHSSSSARPTVDEMKCSPLSTVPAQANTDYRDGSKLLTSKAIKQALRAKKQSEKKKKSINSTKDRRQKEKKDRRKEEEKRKGGERR